MSFRRFLGITLAIILLGTLNPMQIEAAKASDRYYMGETVNAGKDKGYSKTDAIDKDDVHYNWVLGEFYVEGHTREVLDDEGNPIFLKNVGDEVTLWFDLQQDITELNGNDKLYIYEDSNGYMEKYGLEKSNIGKGTLIIRHTNYQNKTGEPQIYTDYLSAKKSEGADTEVILCEEGDYEVCLLYEVKNDGFLFFDAYSNYKIEFKFSVRNGNTMVFPFDVATGQELGNSSFTENGFRLDLAKSRYLTIDVKRDVWTEGADGWTTDTRFNKPAADGEEYVDEGIYTITVKNPYTNAVTEKKIYVGTNSILKAHVTTGLSIEDIETLLDNGAIINEDGTITTQSNEEVPSTENEPVIENTEKQEDSSEVIDTNKPTIVEKENYAWIGVVCALIVTVVGVVVIIKRRKVNSEVPKIEELESVDDFETPNDQE